MRSRLAVVVVCALGCGPNLKAVSADSIGCAPDDILISNDEALGVAHVRTWTATAVCRHKTTNYECVMPEQVAICNVKQP